MEGAEVALAGDAQQALASAVEGRFDAVISDVAMPGRDGLWLAAQLRAGERTRRLPLVAVSGMARAADRTKALSAGFDALLAKPLDLDAVCFEVTHAIADRKSSR